jgi:hypothetical protein
MASDRTTTAYSARRDPVMTFIWGVFVGGLLQAAFLGIFNGGCVW